MLGFGFTQIEVIITDTHIPLNFITYCTSRQISAYFDNLPIQSRLLFYPRTILKIKDRNSWF